MYMVDKKTKTMICPPQRITGLVNSKTVSLTFDVYYGFLSAFCECSVRVDRVRCKSLLRMSTD